MGNWILQSKKTNQSVSCTKEKEEVARIYTGGQIATVSHLKLKTK